MNSMVLTGRCVAVLLLVGQVFAAPETEPNDDAGTASPIAPGEVVTGSIAMPGDTDYFLVNGINPTWGFVALLDTSGSSSSTAGRLAALASDGVTVLSDGTSSWVRGAGIGPQSFVDGRANHYLRVTEDGNDAAISDYQLRYFTTVVASQPEVEPNADIASATPSAFTMRGTLSAPGDVDCYAFEGRDGHTMLLALNSDPEGDGSATDYVLELVDSTGTALASVDHSGPGRGEYLEFESLPGDAVYGYCVRATSGAGPTATYTVGILSNGGLYYVDWRQGPVLTDPASGNSVAVGESLTFRLEAANEGGVAIPGAIQLSARYPATCLSLVATEPPATSSSAGEVDWYGQKMDGLAPGELYTVTLTLRAFAECQGELHQSTVFEYFLTGTGNSVAFEVSGFSAGLLLPPILDLILDE